ncbi:UNVERIFIED_ORG: hypothetical protein ABIB19_003494 [Arthrobacter sp. UYEF10]
MASGMENRRGTPNRVEDADQLTDGRGPVRTLTRTPRIMWTEPALRAPPPAETPNQPHNPAVHVMAQDVRGDSLVRQRWAARCRGAGIFVHQPFNGVGTQRCAVSAWEQWRAVGCRGRAGHKIRASNAWANHWSDSSWSQSSSRAVAASSSWKAARVFGNVSPASGSIGHKPIAFVSTTFTWSRGRGADCVDVANQVPGENGKGAGRRQTARQWRVQAQGREAVMWASLNWS